MSKYERFYKYALEVDSGYYVVPKYARKDKKYTCIKCDAECIVCDGDIKEKYIRHKAKGDCNYFDTGLKISQKNNYDPKIRDLFHNASIVYLQNCLNKGNKIIITKKCNLKYKCLNIVKTIKLEDGDSVKIEKSFYVNGMIKRGDLCILDKDGNIKIILEIYDTHRTNEDDRPNNIEWYELDVNDIMKYYDDDENYDKINLNCRRYYVCNPCENHRQEILKRQKEEYEQRQNLKDIDNNFLIRIYFQLWYTNIRYPQAQAYSRFLVEKYDYHKIYQKHLKYNDYVKNYLKDKYKNDEKYKQYMLDKSKRQYERRKNDILRMKMSPC